MPVIVVANPKGGSGKSTLSSNVAGFFASKGHAVMLGDANGWIAQFAFADRVRENSSGLIAGLKAAGLRVHLVSGDRQSSVEHVARELGIPAVLAAALPALPAASL